MSLCSFVLSNCYDVCNQSQSSSKKKKQQSNSNEVSENTRSLSMKEKVLLVTDVLKELKNSLSTTDSSLGNSFINISIVDDDNNVILNV